MKNTVTVSRRWFEGLLEEAKKTEKLQANFNYSGIEPENQALVSQAAALTGYAKSAEFILSENYDAISG